METISQTYHISNSTLALLPAREIDYDTIVMKTNETIMHVRQTAFNLIKSAIIKHDCTTYDGRRDAIIKRTGFKQKTPILISILNSLYFFPTHSPNHADNVWIAFHHIVGTGKVPKEQATNQDRSIVYFKDGSELILNISFHILREQYDRTAQCVLNIEGMEGIKKIYPW